MSFNRERTAAAERSFRRAGATGLTGFRTPRAAHRRTGRRPFNADSNRRGFSMILVMLAIGFSLALTYGFMRTQVTSLQLTQNEIRRDLALEAARSGISACLLRMQSPAWIGLSDTYSKITQQDSANLVSCAVTYTAVTPGQVAGVSDAELPLHVCLTSTGTWSSPRDSTLTVKRTIKAVVRLVPRLPGRTARAGDIATASDLSVNPSGYQATLPYTLTTTSSSSSSVNFDPGTRFEGPLWIRNGLAMFNRERWSTTIRGSMLTEIGNQYGATNPSTFIHPHPLNGPVRFSTSPSGSVQTDLSRLKTSWSTTTETPSVAALNANSWLTYRLYDRGPVYQAAVLSSSLSNVTLQPSVSNPLGIFVRSGNLDVYSNVTVQGTLVVTGTLTFWGQGTVATAYNWVSSSGSPAVTDADTWPRLPALVAKNMNFSNSTRTVIEGAVIIDGQLSGGGCDYSTSAANQVSLSGTATATRGQQPYSTVQLQGSPDLSSVSGNQVYAVWLSNGTSGRWYQIQSVNSEARTLTVVGEASTNGAVPYKIRLNRSQFVSLNGPVVTGTALLDSEAMWGMVSIIWTNTYSDWNATNSILLSQGLPRISLSDWVANPANLTNQGWFLPWLTYIYGLQIEPTFTIQPTPGVGYLANAPLFTPYSSTGSDSAASGYRWKVVDWREDL
jgi:Tfp pilus assembly protein PilX